MTLTREDLRGGAIYVYKLTSDNGGAPCVHAGILSLAICKQHVRTSAQLGDWIIGFGGKSVPELKDRLIYVARVTGVADNGDYYTTEKYRQRPDCVYERSGSEYKWREGSKFHKDQLAHDLGLANGYDRVRVLLSDQFVYCGGALNPSIEDVKDVYEGLPRDFARNHEFEVRYKLEGFIIHVVNQYSERQPGQPTQDDTNCRCNECEGDVRKC